MRTKLKNHPLAPLLLIAFNRPKIVDTLLNTLSQQDLSNRVVYVSIDGPRINNTNDVSNTKKVKKLFKTFETQYNISISYLISTENQGCKQSVSNAITEVLRNHDRVIILEDDCIPSSSFLPYCDELLERHKNNDQVMMINGTTFVEDQCIEQSHRLSKCTFVWGWATWSRAWNKYDVDMFDYDTKGASVLNKIMKYFGKFGLSMTRLIDAVHRKHVDTWDAQWAYTLWKQSQFFTILPNVNLINNIGFGIDSTHTKIRSSLENRITKIIYFPLGKIYAPVNMQKLDIAQYAQVKQMTSILSVIRHWLNIFLGKK